MDNIKTESIKLILSAMDDSNFDNIKELSIDRFSIDSEIQTVDLKELTYFNNLESLTLKNLSLSIEDFELFSGLSNLIKLDLINCELLDDNINFSTMNSLKRLCLDNINIDLAKMNINLELFIVKNMEYIKNNVYSDILDISKAYYKVEELDGINVNTLIINHSKYYENKEFFDFLSSNIHIIVKEDKYDSVEVEL